MNRTTGFAVLVFSGVAAGLASANSAGAPPTVDPARQTVIENHMAQWASVKVRANRLSATFLHGIAGDPRYRYADYRARVDGAWQASIAREKEEQNRQAMGVAKLAADASAGKITPPQKDACAGALSQILQLRMLYVYGTLFPRLLDESVRTGAQPTGHFIAGPEWQLEVSPQEMQVLGAKYKALCGVEPDLFAEN